MASNFPEYEKRITAASPSMIWVRLKCRTMFGLATRMEFTRRRDYRKADKIVKFVVKSIFDAFINCKIKNKG